MLGKLGDTSGITLAVGLASLAVVLGLRRVAPVVPASLVAVLLGIVAVDLFHLDRHGVEIVGHIDSGLPSFGLPDVAAHRYLDVAASARRRDADRLRRGARRREDVRRPGTTTRSTRTAS